VAERFPQPPKGEITLVLDAADVVVGNELPAIEAVAELVAAGLARRRAADLVARLTGVRRNTLYRGSL